MGTDRVGRTLTSVNVPSPLLWNKWSLSPGRDCASLTGACAAPVETPICGEGCGFPFGADCPATRTDNSIQIRKAAEETFEIRIGISRDNPLMSTSTGETPLHLRPIPSHRAHEASMFSNVLPRVSGSCNLIKTKPKPQTRA